MTILDTLHDRLVRTPRRYGGRRRRASLRPRLEELEVRVVLDGTATTTIPDDLARGAWSSASQ